MVEDRRQTIPDMNMVKAREWKSSSKNQQATIARLPHASNLPLFHVRGKNSEIEKSSFSKKDIQDYRGIKDFKGGTLWSWEVER